MRECCVEYILTERTKIPKGVDGARSQENRRGKRCWQDVLISDIMKRLEKKDQEEEKKEDEKKEEKEEEKKEESQQQMNVDHAIVKSEVSNGTTQQ